ncbi:DUF6161 domain-containing protein [Hoeflea sp.]|uniref:DUF6161 domain-containing protein n=1 Tax=Hoeflea sp. TaxID=1940281 RepID=UPI003A8D9F06
MTDIPDKHVHLECLEQDVPGKLYSAEELRNFAQTEADYWHSVPNTSDPIYHFGESRFRGPNFVEAYKEHWNQVLNSEPKEMFERVGVIFSQAQRLQFVLASGSMRQRIDFIQFADANDLNMALSLYSGGVLDIPEDVRRKLGFLNDVIRLHPGFSAGLALTTAQRSGNEIQKALSSIRQDQRNASEFFSSRKEELQQLHDLYEQKLQLEWPSTYWRDATRKANLSAWAWLAVFSVMVLVPLLLLILNFGAITSHVAAISSDSGGISLGTAVLVTAPIFAYGWLLKHISRGYVQNFLLAADASHRRMMVLTYLAIAKRKYTDISQSDRALILNALFRPVAPNTGDDGPPTGILELIKK